MKKILSLLTIAVVLQMLFATASIAQVHYNQFGLMKADGSTPTPLYLGANRTATQAALGSPSRTSTENLEMDGVTAIVWHYGDCKLYFVADALTSYTIMDGTLVVGGDYANSYGIHTAMGTVQTPRATRDYFYGYPISRTPGTSHNIPYSYVSASHLANNSGALDGHFEVLFDSNKEVIHISVED